MGWLVGDVAMTAHAGAFTGRGRDKRLRKAHITLRVLPFADGSTGGG